jgi:D-glycero-alpha-D-manno-heptose-7-phosphate kinase
LIISKTPFRISFFGGGTDYPEWVRLHGGAVLGTTINHGCYISCRTLPPIFDHHYRIVYSKTESVQRVQEIEHPVVRAVLHELNLDHTRLEIHHDADLPSRAGLGSSSAFTVGLLNALFHLKDTALDPSELARLAILIEQEKLKEVVGYQDQTLTAYGGFNRIDFFQNGEIDVTPIFSPHLQDLENHLMLFYTGYTRFASPIAQSKVVNFKKNHHRLYRLREMVDEALEKLTNPTFDLTWFGELLDEAWMLKRGLSDKISNPTLDHIYEKGKKHGAIGGKLLGAGGGGFMLFFVPPDRQMDLKKGLSSIPKLCPIPFTFETRGTHLLCEQQKLSSLPLNNRNFNSQSV